MLFFVYTFECLLDPYTAHNSLRHKRAQQPNVYFEYAREKYFNRFSIRCEVPNANTRKNANKRTVTKNSFLALLAHHLFRFTHKYFADDVLNSSFNATFNESNYSFVQFILYMVVLIIFVTLDDKNIKIHQSIVTERTLKLLANSIEM